jgi:hypothetical protein
LIVIASFFDHVSFIYDSGFINVAIFNHCQELVDHAWFIDGAGLISCALFHRNHGFLIVLVLLMVIN